MEISSIADHLELLPTVARWHWDEWGHVDPDGSLETWTAGLAERTNRDCIPATFLAFEGGTPVGSAVLVEHDMETRRDLSPWLAGVYVLPAYRGAGVASALCTHATREAARWGFLELYLHTHSAVPLYQKLGWKGIGTEFYEGRDVALMHVELPT